MGKYSSHASYMYGDKEVPSVTTILKTLNKPALQKWANYLGFKRMNVDEVLNEKALIGTMVHEVLYAYLNQKYFLWVQKEEYCTKPLMATYMSGFVEWEKLGNDMEPEFMEKQFSTNRYGGTVDFYGLYNGKKTILDFKTSKDFYMSMFLQLSAYVKMLETHGHEVEQIGIVRVNPGRTDVKLMDRKDIDIFIEFFDNLTETFHYNFILEKEWKGKIK